LSLDEEVDAAVACKSKGSPQVPAERRRAGRPRPFELDSGLSPASHGVGMSAPDFARHLRDVPEHVAALGVDAPAIDFDLHSHRHPNPLAL
jgi:hypothetical protein